ncbi:hypothetical protein IJI17_02215 [Candidatus Saccharibacteria bacterium]|nr:hypothetical protein [Candidatus Saccharibacteria bacterium]
MEALEDNAAEHDRDMTEREAERYDRMEDKWAAANTAREAVEDALAAMHEVM